MYKFRGIDDVYNAISPIISKYGLCILPRTMSREVTERKSNSGGLLSVVVVLMEFDFVSSEDGSKHTVSMYGEAMDSGDKATNKAMSAAYKYAMFQTFSIPTEGDNDPDATVHPPTAPTTTFKQKATEEKKPYQDDDIAKNMLTWGQWFSEGKQTADELINKILTKYTLTDAQILRIKNLESGQQLHALAEEFGEPKND
jgi:hypothetical protein